MGMDLYAEVEHAKYLDKIDNNIEKGFIIIPIYHSEEDEVKSFDTDCIQEEFDDYIEKIESMNEKNKCQGCGNIKGECVCSKNIEER